MEHYNSVYRLNINTIYWSDFMDLSLLIIIILMVSILVALLLNYIFKGKRYIKYIPAIIILPFMIYNFITMYSAPSEGFEALGRFVMGLLLLSACIPSLICSVVLDVFYARRKYSD